MNSGAITKRYATALLLLTQESGRGEQVCSQVRAMLRDSNRIPPTLEKDLETFIALLAKKGRTDYLRRIFRTFVDLYCESVGLRHVTLVSAVPSPQLERQGHEPTRKSAGIGAPAWQCLRYSGLLSHKQRPVQEW